MPDPYEGVAADGTIRTGARRDRVPTLFEPVVADAVELARGSGASLYVYGSVATGTARPPASDVDLLSMGLPDPVAVGRVLSERYADRCRAVEVAAGTPDDLGGDGDEAYGNRVFLRHYCVHLTGPDRAADLPAYPADARAARGFNGDLHRHLERWRAGLERSTQPAEEIGVRAARKTLLAVAGLVSVHDRTWTTDRAIAVERWSAVDPTLAADLLRLHGWATGQRVPVRHEVAAAVSEGAVIAAVVDRFRARVGLWGD